MPLLTFPWPQILSAGGSTYPGAKLFFYETGTSTLATTYTDAALTTPHTNPVIADATGVFPPIYLANKRYKAVLKTAGDVTLFTADPVMGSGDDTVATIAAMTAIDTPTNGATVQVADVNRGGLFVFDTSATSAADNGVTFKADDATSGSWVRQYSGPVMVKWYGTDTAAVTGALAEAAGSTSVIFESVTYNVGTFTIPANSHLIMPPGCILQDTGLLGEFQRLVNITNDDVVIDGAGAKVLMDRADYTTGEQRHGVFIYGAQRVTINGLESSNCGGDGFYIGGDAGDPATDIRLVAVKADNNRRQGISLVSGRRVRIIDPLLTNTTGTAPSAGLDIEPNAAADALEDIKVVRPRCIGNDGPGIEIFLAAWNSTSNYADIEITDAYSKSNGAVTISGRQRGGLDINRIGSTTPCGGVVRIVNFTSVDDECAGIHIYDWDVNGPRVEIIRPTVINPNQIEGDASPINGGIILHNSTTFTTTPGNVYIETPTIIDDDGFLNSNSLVPIRISGAWKQVEITNPNATYAGTTTWLPDVASTPVIVNDTEIRFDTSNGQTMVDWRFVGKTLTNAGATGAITHTLPASVEGIVLDFALLESQEMRIAPNAADQIVPTGSAANKYISASVRGSRVRLRCREAGFWDMENVSGTWTSEA